MKQILFAYPLPAECYEPYRNEFSFTVSDHILTPEEIAERVPGFDACMVAGNSVTPAVIDRGDRLKAIGNLGVGYDNIDWQYATKKGIAVVNTPTQVTETTAEHAVALMMATMRGVLRFDKQLRAGQWGADLFPKENMELHGRTLGIMGFGRIGKVVCQKAQGLGMNVVYYDAFRATPEIEKEYGVTYLEMDELLKVSDCITLHIPYTPENHHLFNKETFAKMKPGAYLINAARGPIVDEAALVEALKDGTLGGAGLDVFEEEPKVHPGLLELDNVVLTPHIASAIRQTRMNMATESLSGVMGVLRGEKPVNVINKQVL